MLSLTSVARRAPAWLIATGLYIALTLVVTFPAVTQLNTHVIGDDSDSADVHEAVWSLWWWQRALFDLGQSPLDINLLNHPDGLAFPLYPLMAQPFMLGAPLAAMASPVLAYNLLVLASFALCGLAGYRLCTDLSGDARAGFVGGLIWAVFPAKTAHVVAGHLSLIFLAALPLAALALRRLLATPTPRNASLTALALFAAATIHPIYLPYFLAPLVVGLLIEALAREGRRFWSRDRLIWLSAALGLAGIAGVLLALPALRELASGGAVFSNPTADVIGRSPDALAYFVPSSDHPLLQALALRDFAVRVVPYQYEHLTYVGWLALGLAILGARARRKEGRVWVWLGIIAAVLALGPLLKIGGDFLWVNVAGERYRVVLPYAFLSDLPLLQWSRTPGRWTVLLMFAVAVLAAFGVQRLLQYPSFAARPSIIIGVLTLVIALETIVRWPFPTFAMNAPTPVTALRAEVDGKAVLQIPLEGYAENQRALFWQTVHQHPLVGGRLYRDVPEVTLTHAFYRELIAGTPDSDLVPTSTEEARLAALHGAGISWVLYDKLANLEDVMRLKLEARLGPPMMEDAEAALYAVPAGESSTADLIWELGPGWEERPSGARRFCEQGVLYLYSSGERADRLAFTAVPVDGPRQIQLWLNGQSAGLFLIGDEGDYWSDVLVFKPGLNIVELALTEQTLLGERCEGQSGTWGPALGGVRLLADAEALPITTSEAVFGDAMHLLGYVAPQKVSSGQVLSVRLMWRALGVIGEDLTVFVHLVGSEGQLIAQSDGPPVGGAYPTSKWVADEIIAYTVALALPKKIPPGSYTLRVGVYRPTSLERLPVTHATSDDNAIVLGIVTLQP